MDEVNILFAVDAEHLLINGESSEAILLLKNGLRKYPEYTAAYCLLAKAYDEVGETETALETVEIALERFPNTQSLIGIKSYLEEKQAEETYLFINYNDFNYKPDSSRPYNSTKPDLIPGLDFISQAFDTINVQANSQSYENHSITEDILNNMDDKAREIAELSKNLSFHIQIKEKEKVSGNSDDTVDDPDIATETMAILFEQQGAYAQAIKVYEQLIELKPENSENYYEKIEYLNLL